MAKAISGSGLTALAGSIALALLTLTGCNGFGTGNATQPGNTPNVSEQSSYRMVGDIGTPFVATITDARSSWTFSGVVPYNVIIMNVPILNGFGGPTRLVATKLTNDSRLLSVEVISALAVASVSSTSSNYGTVVGALGAKLQQFAAPASPDVRFLISGPFNGVFNGVVEDLTTAFILQARAPTLILFDSPNNNSQTERVDGIFNLVNNGNPFNIDLFFNGRIVSHGGGLGTVTVKAN